MKTIKNVFSQIASFENLYLAYKQARKCKRVRDYVIEFEECLEENLLELSAQLNAGTYIPGKYRNFFIYEPKARLISAAPFRDRIVHHAIIQVIEPLIDKSFIEDSYACRKGKGTSKAIKRCQKFAKRFGWALKCDIQKFFPSIDHEILLEVLSRRIRDKKLIELLQLILSSYHNNELFIDWFEGDNLLTPIERNHGIPIGNLTSQFFANLYLNELDQFVKHDMHMRGYIRYMDDFIIFGNSKDDLEYIRDKIIDLLLQFRLKIHTNKLEIFPVKNGISFLGFLIYQDRKRLCRNIITKFNNRNRKYLRMVKCRKIALEKYRQCLLSWVGFANLGDTWNLRKKLFVPYIARIAIIASGFLVFS